MHALRHIKEHVQQLLTEEELKTLSKEQLEFYYFKLHDYDNNNKLDGLEMLGAMTHYRHKKDGEEHVTTLDEGLSEDILTEAVDASLKAADSNDDGYIEYHEYYTAIRRREAIAEKQEKDALWNRGQIFASCMV